MTTLTPEKIFNTLNTKFSTIVGHAIVGYFKVYQYETEFLSSLSEFGEMNDVTEVEMYLMISNSNIIQYGKSYFLQQIMYNLIQMNILTNYINIFKPNTEEQRGGGNELVQYIIKFMVIMLITNLTNATSVALSMSPLTEVSTSVNIAEGILPQANAYNGEVIKRLNPLNDTAIMEFTEKYVLNPVIPENSKNSVNIYETNFIENFKKSLSFFENTFNSDNTIRSKFIEKLEGQIKYINELTGATNSALNDVCKSFTNVADKNLPVTLYDLFNSKMNEQMPNLQEKQEKLIEAKIAEIEQNYPSKTNTFKITDIFSWSSKKSSTSPDSKEIVSKDDISKSIINVEQAINQQMPVFIKELDVKLAQEAAENVKNEIIKQANEELRITNLQIYFAAICKIKKPYYVFNKTNGELYIQNPARSRFHLQTLADNVKVYYKQVVSKGVPEDKLLKMQSLFEKSTLITTILTNYDLGLADTFDTEINNSQDINTFFNTIAKMWIDLKTDMLKGLSQFPITELQNELDIKNKINDINTKLEHQSQIHEVKIKEEEQKIRENQELNNVSLHNWKVNNEYFNTQVEGSLGFVKTAFIGIVNATTDVGASTLDSANLLLSKGVGSVMTLIWAIVFGGTILFIPPILYLSIKSGYVTSLFKSAQRRLTATPSAAAAPSPTTPSPTATATRDTLNYEPYNPNIDYSREYREYKNAQGPFQSTRFQVIPDPITDGVDELTDMFRNIGSLHGGKLIYNKKKTRKNKKRKTKKLKGKNKRRHTRNKNGVRSKRR